MRKTSKQGTSSCTSIFYVSWYVWWWFLWMFIEQATSSMRLFSCNNLCRTWIINAGYVSRFVYTRRKRTRKLLRFEMVWLEIQRNCTEWRQRSEEFLTFAFAFAQCKWTLTRYMICRCCTMRFSSVENKLDSHIMRCSPQSISHPDFNTSALHLLW